MFRAPPFPSSGAQQLTVAASGFTLEHGGSSAVSRLTTLLPPRSKLKPEAVNAVLSS